MGVISDIRARFRASRACHVRAVDHFAASHPPNAVFPSVPGEGVLVKQANWFIWAHPGFLSSRMSTWTPHAPHLFGMCNKKRRVGRVSLKVDRMLGWRRVWKPRELFVSGTTLQACEVEQNKATSGCEVRFSCRRESSALWFRALSWRVGGRVVQ